MKTVIFLSVVVVPAWFTSPAGAQFGGMMDELPVVKALDVDGDGALSADEISNAAAALRLLDDDGDGALARGEWGRERRSGWDDWGDMDDWDFGSGGRRGRADPPTKLLTPTELEIEDGTDTISDRATFKSLAYEKGMVMPHLEGLEFVKFQIEEVDTDDPKLYFINTRTHPTHVGFMRAIGAGRGRSWGMRGVLVHRPLLMSPGGKPGLYTFEFEPEDQHPVERVAFARDLLEAHSPLLKNNLAYHPLPRARQLYSREKSKFEAAAIPVFLPEDRYADIAFLPLNEAESYGRLRRMRMQERPGPRDVAIYPTLPNELPRVAGVITGVRQTPLSHVNLRAVQDGVPNAYIFGVADDPEITGLVGKYVRYRVTSDGYELREATLDEVNAHFAALRPDALQIPERDLTEIEIRPLDRVGFRDASSFGVKAANVAAMRKFALPDGMVPDGFAIPFAFYDAFMKHNGLYEKAASMRDRSEFQNDPERRRAALSDLRAEIEQAEFPEPFATGLQELQAAFGEGQPVRCRSSTNNEDLPGFSGAGLYDSVTHRPEEGRLSKSIRQVYASLWSYRAYEEREFHRIDHFAAAMAVLVHPNYDGEQVNGVAVADDIVYQTGGLSTGRRYYINAQVGEDLVTQPSRDSVPEELLLSPRFPREDTVVRRSSRAGGEPLLNRARLDELRVALKTIQREFSALYGKSPEDRFAMEIEFKVTKEGGLAIKQARPWLYSPAR